MEELGHLHGGGSRVKLVLGSEVVHANEGFWLAVGGDLGNGSGSQIPGEHGFNQSKCTIWRLWLSRVC